jgi:hypothetical protein
VERRYYEWTREQLATLVLGARVKFPDNAIGALVDATVLEAGGRRLQGPQGVITLMGAPNMIDPASVRPPPPTGRDVLKAIAELEEQWSDGGPDADANAQGAVLECREQLAALRKRFEALL